FFNNWYNTEKLKTLSNALAQWKIAKSTTKAEDYLNQALAKFNQTIQPARETFNSNHDSLNHSLDILESNLTQTTQAQRVNVFWEPEYPDEPPSNLLSHHWNQLKDSAIHPDLIALNAESLSGNAVYERLLDEKLSRMGSGQYVTAPMAREMKKYEQVAEGGWWGHAGIDALSLVDLKAGEKPKMADWGCFKPDHPRIDQAKSEKKGKTEYRKYENPALAPRVPFLPQVSESLAQKIYEKHGINPTEQERQSGFWFVVKQYPQIPITITEGFKKTLSSLSQGVVTIGLSGVNHIYRANDSQGNKLPTRELNPEVAVFAKEGREFLFAYDSDTKPTTIVNVRRDRVRGIELLESLSCPCSVLTWNSSDGKGLDDLIAAKGPEAYLQAHQNAVSSEQDKRIHYRTEYNKIVTQIKREMGSVASPRLDLEVYLRATAKGEKADGIRVVGESDTARSLRKNLPKEAELYAKAIEMSAGLYERLGRKAAQKNLDELLRQTVSRQMVALGLEKEDLALKPSSRLSRSR
ncbi:DUF3854 domain-containing protein, partial [Chroococcus sp. FPU101]|uniref:DUF3854 domain-containing protein n=1 Tax=Chroococcus sp. FPU101 TaxID=1974212 RepID=UPI001A8C00F6